MKVKDILTTDYVRLTHEASDDFYFKGCYQTDLLSAAIKSADSDNILITIISHLNTVALAVMIDLPCIIICEQKPVSDEMIKRANDNNIAILQTHLKSYEVIIDLYQRGLL